MAPKRSQFAPTSTSTSSEPAQPTPEPAPLSAAAADAEPTHPPQPKKRKKQSPHILYTSTFRKPRWSYLHLQLLAPTLYPTSTKPCTTTTTAGSAANTPTAPTSPPPPDLPPLTTSLLLTSALTAFLGLTGSSIPVDILHTAGMHVYVRVPREEGRAVQAALAGWTGTCGVGELDVEGSGSGSGRVGVAWRVVGCGGSLGVVVGGDGADVFGG